MELDNEQVHVGLLGKLQAELLEVEVELVVVGDAVVVVVVVWVVVVV